MSQVQVPLQAPKRHNAYNEVINKIALSSNDYKRMQSVDSTETYAYVECKDIIYVKEKIKYYNVTQSCLTLIMFQKKI